MVGRNEPCPCGSGKKYKRCCASGRSPSEAATMPELAAGLSIKSAGEIDGMRRSGRLAARILATACARVGPGVTTNEINRWVHDTTLEAGAYPSPLNYPNAPTDPRNPTIGRRGFPKSVCTSVNDVVCHGIPDDTPLDEGDIVNVDVTCTLDGFFGDTSRTLYVGEVTKEARLVTEGARDALDEALQVVQAGAMFDEIGRVIEELSHGRGLSVVRDFTGHGIGQKFHEPPAVLHYRDASLRFPMQAGMTFTIEPMLNVGTHRVMVSREDGWTARTMDGALSAQFEHTLLVTETGCEVLTAAPS